MANKVQVQAQQKKRLISLESKNKGWNKEFGLHGLQDAVRLGWGGVREGGGAREHISFLPFFV